MPSIEPRVGKDGTKTFRAYVRIKGHPRQSATFKRKSDAVRWAQKTEAEILDGKYFPTNAAKHYLLSQLIKRYKEDVLPHKKPGSKRAQEYQLDWWNDKLGAYTLDRITPALIAEYRDKLARDTGPIGKKKKPASEPANADDDTEKEAANGKRRSPATVARFMAALSHVFTMAVKEWQLMDDNPFRRVTKPKEPRGMVRFLSDQERDSLLKVCKAAGSKDLYCAVVIALSTGCRKAELMTLQWTQVDLERGLLTFEDTKNGERRTVPLVSHAHALMKSRSENQKPKSDFVFPGRKKGKTIDLTRPWKEALKKAGVQNFRWHDLRHSCASYLVMNGATPSEVAEVLGHKTLQMVKRYAHFSEAHTSKIVSAMNEKIFSKEG